MHESIATLANTNHQRQWNLFEGWYRKFMQSESIEVAWMLARTSVMACDLTVDLSDN